MEAGHQMHQFAIDLFNKLDSGHNVDNLYMLNGQFKDSLKPLFNKSGNDNMTVLDRIRVQFTPEFKKK